MPSIADSKNSCSVCEKPVARNSKLCLTCYRVTPRVVRYMDCKSSGCANRVNTLNQTGLCRKCYLRSYNKIHGNSYREEAPDSLGRHWQMPEGKPLPYIPDYKTDTIKKNTKELRHD